MKLSIALTKLAYFTDKVDVFLLPTSLRGPPAFLGKDVHLSLLRPFLPPCLLLLLIVLIVSRKSRACLELVILILHPGGIALL